ncbi:MAG: NRDE family protein [Fulvivirga sp.]|nr:NRDE family protein [Fulvivirga sp.]
MCLILMAYKNHPDYKLIIAANRDEFYQRETEPAHFWNENPEILAGRDKVAGGTWMGVHTSGKISMLTNFRDLSNIKADAPSRGFLVSNYLQKDVPPSQYLKKVAEKGNQYNGFNLICGDAEQLYYYGNYQDGVHRISAGYHGLSNALLNTNWPKIEKGKQKLKDTIQRSFDEQDLFEILYDDIRAPIESLPDTGVGQEKEHMLSSMFIKSENYGSRCSTVLIIDQNNIMTFAERTYDITDFSFVERSFELSIQ